jgi:hypothetical protein
METAATVETVEKPKNGFPTVPTVAWKTLRKKRSEFPTVPTAPTTTSLGEENRTCAARLVQNRMDKKESEA